MHRRVVIYITALVAVGAAGTVLPQFVPSVAGSVERHWWVGWLVAWLALAAVVYQEERNVRLADSRDATSRIAGENQRLETELDDLRARVEDFRPAPAVQDQKLPRLRLSTPAPNDGLTSPTGYPIYNDSASHEISGLQVTSATPGVTVLSLSDTSLGKTVESQSGEPSLDAIIVDVEFAGGRPVPWRAVLTYSAQTRISLNQDLP